MSDTEAVIQPRRIRPYPIFRRFVAMLFLLFIAALFWVQADRLLARLKWYWISAAVFGPVVIAYLALENGRINKHKALVEMAMAKISRQDKAWKNPELRTYVRRSYLRIQRAWCRQDLASLKKDLAPGLYRAWASQIAKLHKRGERNLLEGLRVHEIRFVKVRDFKNDARDSFTVCIDTTAADYTVLNKGLIVRSNSMDWRDRLLKWPSQDSFREFWTFRRKGRRNWILKEVQHEEAWRASITEERIHGEA